MSELTKLLEKAAGGDADSLNQLYDQVYAELRAIAAHKMTAERDGHTLQPTARPCAGSSWTAPAATASSNAAVTRNGWNCTKPGSPRRSTTRSSSKSMKPSMR